MEGWKNVSTLLSILYKHYSLKLKKEDLSTFLNFLQQFGLTSCLEKDYKGRLLLTFWKEESNKLTFCMEEEDGFYQIHQTFELTDLFLENVIRESITEFNVTTVAEHQYHENVMLYDYQNGIIAAIVEKTENVEKVIYQFPKMPLSIKNKPLSVNKVAEIKKEINALLDKRNDPASYQEVAKIDQRLKTLTLQMKNQKLSY